MTTSIRKQAPSSLPPLETESCSNNNKRRRLNDDDNDATDKNDDSNTVFSESHSTVSTQFHSTAASSFFGALNVDCLVSILSFLAAEDMNSFAQCNQRCRKVRNSELLDQTRTGTIVCSNRSTLGSLVRALHVAQNVLTTHYVHFKIVGIPSSAISDGARDHPPSRQTRPLLQQVKHLELFMDATTTNNNEQRGVDDDGDSISFVGRVLSRFGREGCFPNVQELYMYGSSSFGVVRTITNLRISDFFNDRPNLQRVSVNGCDLPGAVPRAFSLQRTPELCLENCRLVLLGWPWPGTLMMDHPNLERLTILNVTWTLVSTVRNTRITEPMLMKIVRHHQSLRWFRTNMLSADNVAILEQERPEITFVTE